jgi:hypothetical protein
MVRDGDSENLSIMSSTVLKELASKRALSSVPEGQETAPKQRRITSNGGDRSGTSLETDILAKMQTQLENLSTDVQKNGCALEQTSGTFGIYSFG